MGGEVIRAGMLICLALCARAQQPAAPAFGAATIKPGDPNAPGMRMSTTPGLLTLENVSLKFCIERAFGVKDFSLSGPAWLDSARFTILAKPAEGTPREQFNAALRTLLVDRFKMAFHLESNVVSGFALVVDKKGLKVSLAPADRVGSVGMGRGLLDADLSMADFASKLAEVVNRPLRDATGLTGAFDIKLRWTPDSGASAEPGRTPEQPASSDPSLPSSVFGALQEQAGLKLEAQRVPVEILVIDHIERQPTEN
jgi:uncharacterized protein (TIGR03435 family)